MGPSVKFVLTIIDAFPNQKNGDNFFVAKKDNPVGRGVFRTNFFPSQFLEYLPNDRRLFAILLCSSFP